MPKNKQLLVFAIITYHLTIIPSGPRLELADEEWRLFKDLSPRAIPNTETGLRRRLASPIKLETCLNQYCDNPIKAKCAICNNAFYCSLSCLQADCFSHYMECRKDR